MGEFPHSFSEHGGRAPHVVVVGPDRVGLLLVVGAVREWWFDHREDGLRLGLTLVAADEAADSRALRRRYPHFDEACRLVCSSITTPQIRLLLSYRPSSRRTIWDVTTVFVSYTDERASLEAVMQLGGLHTLIRSDRGAHCGPDRAGDAARQGGHATAHFECHDLPPPRPVVPAGRFREQRHRADGQGAARQLPAPRRLDGTYDPSRESHRPWDVLKETYRESNRDSAAHLSSRLDEVGYSVQVTDDWAVALPTFSKKEMDRLAESEHKRWCEERLASGWSYGSEIDHNKSGTLTSSRGASLASHQGSSIARPDASSHLFSPEWSGDRAQAAAS